MVSSRILRGWSTSISWMDPLFCTVGLHCLYSLVPIRIRNVKLTPPVTCAGVSNCARVGINLTEHEQPHLLLVVLHEFVDLQTLDKLHHIKAIQRVHDGIVGCTEYAVGLDLYVVHLVDSAKNLVEEAENLTVFTLKRRSSLCHQPQKCKGHDKRMKTLTGRGGGAD